MTSAEVAALIVAGGRGQRLGAALPKAFVPLGSSPLVLWSLRVFAQVAEISRAVLVVPPGYELLAETLCREAELIIPCAILPGGETRCASVWAGLAALQREPPEIVTIHDAARPFVSPDIVTRTIAAAREGGAAVAACPVTDTLKQVGEDLAIVATADRRRFWQAQTPQTFCFATIYQAYCRARAESWDATDDAALVERAGEPVIVVPDDPGNFKITTAEDLRRAQAFAGRAEPARVGYGLDVHALVPGRRLMLGGIEVPFARGLAGHSDADVVLHAVADALLGAAGLGDIGRHFPDTDEAFKDADSAVLLAGVREMIRAAGFGPVNVDVTIVAQEPRLALHLPRMQQRLAGVLGMAEHAVNVKATTTEGLGFAGRGEGIAAHAVVLLAAEARGPASGI